MRNVNTNTSTHKRKFAKASVENNPDKKPVPSFEVFSFQELFASLAYTLSVENARNNKVHKDFINNNS